MIANDKQLFDYARNLDFNNISSLSELLNSYKFDYITYDEFLIDYVKNNLLIIDARSEKEFNESHIFNSFNFPILTNQERHNVGLIFKKYSQKAALQIALEYAEPKKINLIKFLEKNYTTDKTIIVYCWRGGGRSKYLSKMIIDIGIHPSLIQDGFKSFRKTVYDYFYSNNFPYDLIEISGSTGTGKTELLKILNYDLPVIDLEDSAKHYSSLFGFVPYKIKNVLPVKNQSAFENNIYCSIINNLKNICNPKFFLVESESKKIGDFLVPDNLYEKINSAECIKVECSIENRVRRINKDYFGLDNEGIIEIEKIFVLKERYFRKELSNIVYDNLMKDLKSGNVDSFSETMLTQFYDKKYKDKGKKPLVTINTDDILKAASDIKLFLNTHKFSIVMN